MALASAECWHCRATRYTPPTHSLPSAHLHIHTCTTHGHVSVPAGRLGASRATGLLLLLLLLLPVCVLTCLLLHQEGPW